MHTWTKEVAAIGQAAIYQNVPLSTIRRPCSILLYLSENTIFENLKEISSPANFENS
jgi:hypothetical protein